MDANLQVRAAGIRLAAFDVDGVLTDGKLYFGAAGEELKAFHVLDGHGLKLLARTGIRLALITARQSAAVAHRAANLGIEDVFQGVGSKREIFEALLVKYGLSAHEAAYMGDDLMDLPVLLHCGLALSVPGAPSYVRERAHYVTRCSGGEGAVREACELIMQAQGTFAAVLGSYTQ